MNTAILEKSPLSYTKKVLDAFFQLQKYNRHYSDVIVDATRLDWIKKDETELPNTENKRVYYTMLSTLKGITMLIFSTLLLSMEFRKKIMDLPPLK